MTKHNYFNPQAETHKEFLKEVKENLDQQEWKKTPELIKEITGGKNQGFKDWSSEWTRNVLYSLNNPDLMPEWLITEKRPGQGNDHIYWRLKNQ